MTSPQLTSSLMVERLKVFSIKSGARQVFSLLPFNIALKVLYKIIRQGKEMKRIRIGKEQAKLPLFAGDLILYRKKS